MTRDRLAYDRTVLANERTLLAYLRTALTFLGVGATFVQFFHYLWMTIVGWIFIPLGIATFVIGAWRWFSLRRAIHRHAARAPYAPAPDPTSPATGQ